MGIRICERCGGKWSDRLAECPHCGCTVEEQQELTDARKKRIIGFIIALPIWTTAVAIIVASLCGFRWGKISSLPMEGFEWFRCEINLLVVPFIVATALAVLGFILGGGRRKGTGAFLSIVGCSALFGLVYLFSDTYNYREDPYDDWYRDNVIFSYKNADDFPELINGTAWEDRNGEAAFVFRDGKVYFAAARKGGGWLHGVGNYNIDEGCVSIEINDINIDNITWSGTFRSHRCTLESWRGNLEMEDFRRLHKSDLSRYEFDRNVIELVTLVPRYGEDPMLAEQQDVKDRIEGIRQDSVKMSEFTKNFVDINTFVERKNVDWDRYLKFPEFKDNIENKLVELGYKATDVKRGTREGEGGEYFGYKITTYEKSYSTSDKSKPWSKVIIDDGVCGGYTIYFSDKALQKRFLDSCMKLGYTEYYGDNPKSLTIPMPKETPDGYYNYDSYHENGHCIIYLYDDYVEISFGCV